MTEMQDVKKSRGTGWIIAAAVLYAFALYGLVQAVSPQRTGYEVFGVLLWTAVATALLLRGLRSRR